MFASSLGKDDQTTGKDGIVQGHTYSILTVHEFEHIKVRLLKLRNPWGYQEWSGDWSDNSPLWTPQLKAEIELIEKDDGVFWMPLRDFMKRFESVGFSAYSERTYHSSVQLDFGKIKTKCFRFVLNEDIDNLQANPLALSLFQQGPILQSHSDSQNKDQKMSEFAMVLMKEEGELVEEKTHICE